MKEQKGLAFNRLAALTDEPLLKLDTKKLMPLPYLDAEPPVKPPPESWLEKYDLSLDWHSPVGVPKPKTEQEKAELVRRFLSGLGKLFDPQNNWTFLKILRLTTDYCMRCQTCSEACHVFVASGHQEIYRPTYRSEILRRLYRQYFTPSGKLLKSLVGADIELNYKLVIRLMEVSYRCNVCRRCAQVCPVGIDNGLIAREIRKLFSQEMGIAPKELYAKGTRQHLKVGSSTGMSVGGFKEAIEFIEEDIGDRTGRKIKIPVDKKGADILLIHNAGEYLSWPENPGAFAVLFDAAGIDYTLSSEPVGYDGVNYGLFCDDVELARIGLRHVQIAKKLGVRKIVVGECGHATKTLCVITDRVFPGDLSISEIPRESCLPLFWEIVKSGVIKLDPSRNNFPTTLHDSCNIARLMGIVMPQRNVVKAICPQFREMTPNGARNYCCGGGSGFAIMNELNFPQWRKKVSERMKTKQILEAFRDCLDPSQPKYVIAACSNCKGAMRDLIGHYGLWDKYRITYGGLVELIVNAMADLPKPFIELEFISNE
ncbi:Fe-S oxidoreductase [Thermodesulfitimonas autotrophica]|uniref:Fe-S oxidoreductase n=1 Tax=Thermodesulfitimonas autotrophica TaxID=1894989 RepID=A0A3N5B111_9THEO|nr:(Fe-S)-binding protein [Thermodesulfitimonas autotrophica]RPF42522.1 Fe-S oxidoreductase [Thermodesulfitimonas autotrophica]